MVFNKILGYILLTVGLVLIGWTIWHSYNIFTDKATAPLVFKTQLELGSAAGGSDLMSQINQAVQDQLNQVLSPSAITKILNLTAWALMAFILISAGGVVSGIGVKLTNAK